MARARSKAKFTPTKGLNELVAALYVKPRVEEIVDDVAVAARRLAPGTKEWVTRRDDRVRPEHVKTDRQVVAANVRFDLPSHPWDMGRGRLPKSEGKPRLGKRTYLLYPRDRSDPRVNQNIAGCRCHSIDDDRGISRTIKVRETTVLGTKVKGSVVAESEHAMDAEYGHAYPGLPPAPGTYFMYRAAAEARTATRGR